MSINVLQEREWRKIIGGCEFEIEFTSKRELVLVLSFLWMLMVF